MLTKASIVCCGRTLKYNIYLVLGWYLLGLYGCWGSADLLLACGTTPEMFPCLMSGIWLYWFWNLGFVWMLVLSRHTPSLWHNSRDVSMLYEWGLFVWVVKSQQHYSLQGALDSPRGWSDRAVIQVSLFCALALRLQSDPAVQFDEVGVYSTMLTRVSQSYWLCSCSRDGLHNG
jgi:hypothetical protein